MLVAGSGPTIDHEDEYPAAGGGVAVACRVKGPQLPEELNVKLGVGVTVHGFGGPHGITEIVAFSDLEVQPPEDMV